MFSEDNIPAAHTKEAGGPLIAGVVGVGKPTFEIFGSIVETAYELELNGVINSVQISRHVYELVFGESFTTKESQISFHGKTHQAYLVFRASIQ